MTDTTHRKRAWKWIIGILAALFALLAVALAGGAWWLWGWKLGELRFHESWSPEQRAELQTLANEMKSFSRDVEESNILEKYQETLDEAITEALKTTAEEFEKEGVKINLTQKSPRRHEHRLLDSICFDAGTRMIMAQPYAALRRLTSTGKGDSQAQASVAQVAFRLGHLDLAIEIIRRGENPNAGTQFFDISESAFQSAMLCDHYHDYSRITPIEDRIRLLNVMREHGADINARKEFFPKLKGYDENAHILYFTLSALRTPHDHGAILKWLLEHGMHIDNVYDERAVAHIMVYPGTLPTMQSIWALLPDTPRMKARLLRSAVEDKTPEALDKVRWCLDTLGADPNFNNSFMEYEEEDDGSITEKERVQGSAIDHLLRRVPYARPPVSEENREEFEIWLQKLDLLMEHGAKPSGKRRFVLPPKDESMRKRYEEALQKHHIRTGDDD